MTEKKYLHEVVFIRLALIVLLVMTHAFAPYSGAWEPLSISADIPFYKYLHRFISNVPKSVYFVSLFCFANIYIFSLF